MSFRCSYCGINNIWERFLDTFCIQNKVSNPPTEIWDSPPGTTIINPFKSSLKKDKRIFLDKIQPHNVIDFTSSEEDDWEEIG